MMMMIMILMIMVAMHVDDDDDDDENDDDDNYLPFLSEVCSVMTHYPESPQTLHQALGYCQSKC